VRVRGKGSPGSGGGDAGDLFLRVSVAKHPRFERKGDDLHTEIDVPVTDAALGGEARVPTLKGRTLALTIPPGTQGGRVFRLAGQGMPRSGGGFGDLHARVRLRLPEQLSAEQRELFERLRASENGATAAERSEDAGVAS
jgi:curved DNA-binding protein